MTPEPTLSTLAEACAKEIAIWGVGPEPADETVQALKEIVARHLQPLAKDREMIEELMNGQRLVIPKSKEHAENMYRIAFHYLSSGITPTASGV